MDRYDTIYQDYEDYLIKIHAYHKHLSEEKVIKSLKIKKAIRKTIDIIFALSTIQYLLYLSNYIHISGNKLPLYIISAIIIIIFYIRKYVKSKNKREEEVHFILFKLFEDMENGVHLSDYDKLVIQGFLK